MVTIAISADKGTPKTQLDTLAKQTSLPLLDQHIRADYLLHITTEYLELRKIDHSSKKPKVESIHIDFLAGKANHRRLHGGGKGQDLAKAIGLHKIKEPTILDLTAGMGGDAFVLATLGADVTLIERNPVTYALLNDALSRAKLSADTELLDIIGRMNLNNEDAQQSLNKLEELGKENLPDVIYIDPMFPTRSKSAQVKKEMQFFHNIVGADEDSEQLLLMSLKLANKRIVVKRPRLAEKLTKTIEPAFDIVGKSTRYDVYLPI
ncbi:MAG: class I SAM-dependent methyltransferase [Cocleimonas sp.]|nr:class I SAM-dependent methyltransferase [Cocleimonas sp.]